MADPGIMQFVHDTHTLGGDPPLRRMRRASSDISATARCKNGTGFGCRAAVARNLSVPIRCRGARGGVKRNFRNGWLQKRNGALGARAAVARNPHEAIRRRAARAAVKRYFRNGWLQKRNGALGAARLLPATLTVPVRCRAARDSVKRNFRNGRLQKRNDVPAFESRVTHHDTFGSCCRLSAEHGRVELRRLLRERLRLGHLQPQSFKL
jgi:hypothetical protein